MAVNKVVLNRDGVEEVLIDISDSTVTAETLAEGETAYDKSGEKIVGVMTGDGKTPFYENILYTGEASYIDDGAGNWRVKFLTSGTLTVKNDTVVDLFAVGGGGNGGTGKADYWTITSGTNAGDIYGQGGAGGGGGYTTTVKGTVLPAGTYTVTIGAAAGKSSIVSEDGTTTYCSANGGKSGSAGSAEYVNGGNGGSGGGGGGYANGYGGDGGSDGSDGEFSNGSNEESTTTHKGQGTTTREFGEDTGDLYSGGGGGGGSSWFKAATNATTYGKGGAGGAGGGGNGGSNGTLATKGEANTGGGGGGGAGITSYTTRGAGGTGIVIIRNVRVITAG